MKKTIVALLVLASVQLSAQTKNFIDQPYVETSSIADTLVQPDVVYLHLLLKETDSKNKISVEQQEEKMAQALQELGINLKEQLSLSDLGSNFKKYFLRQKDIVKSKAYSLKVYDAATAGQVIARLEELGIANVNLDRVEFSQIEALKLQLRERAMRQALQQAEMLLKPLNQKVAGALHISDSFQMPKKYKSEELNEVVINSRYKAEDKALQEVEFEAIQVIVTVHAKLKIQ